MAESIGKITVAIEAQTAELQSGLQKAEQEVKKSADKMAEGQQSLGKKISGSWTEMSSKLMVMQASIDATASALQVMGDIVGIWGEEGISSSVKLGASIQSVGDAGIPVVSGIAKAGEALAEIFVQSASKIAEVEKKLKEFEMGILKLVEARRKMSAVDDMTYLMRRKAVELSLFELQMSEQSNVYREHITKRMMMREDLERQLEDKIKAMGAIGAGHKSMTSDMERILKIFDAETDLQKKKIEQEQQLKDEARNAELQKEKDAILAKAKAEADAQKKIADKTMDLQTKLSIMQAKQAGNEDKARELAITSRYEKMKQGATEAQKLIIDQMQAIELASGGGTGATTAGGGGGGTANISTAIGSFTVASGRMETKKQTSLLKRIADSNEKVAEAVTNNNNGIVVPQ